MNFRPALGTPKGIGTVILRGNPETRRWTYLAMCSVQFNVRYGAADSQTYVSTEHTANRRRPNPRLVVREPRRIGYRLSNII